jgi:hypothetical protein
MTSRLLVDKVEGKSTSGTVQIPNHIIQTQQTIFSTVESISSTSFTNSSVTVNITPTGSSSKIRVTINGFFGMNFWHASPYLRLNRDSTTISNNEIAIWPRVQYDQTRDSESCVPCVMDILDSPSTTSQITYTLQARTSNSSYPFLFNRRNASTDAMAQFTITVQEIAL